MDLVCKCILQTNEVKLYEDSYVESTSNEKILHTVKVFLLHPWTYKRKTLLRIITSDSTAKFAQNAKAILITQMKPVKFFYLY